MADTKIAGAFIELSVKGAEKIGPAVDRIKNDVDKKLPAEDTGHMEKFLFGKHGSAGIEHTLLHTAGHLGKLFGAGGLFAVGTVITEKLTEALFNNVLGFDKQAAAAENAAKRLERYKDSTDRLTKARVAEENQPKTQAEQLEAGMFPPGMLDRIRAGSDKAKLARTSEAAAREDAANVVLSDADKKQIKDRLGPDHTLQEEQDARAAEIQRRRESASQRAEAAKARAEGAENANITDLESTLGTGARAGLSGAARIGQTILGNGREAIGAWPAGLRDVGRRGAIP